MKFDSKMVKLAAASLLFYGSVCQADGITKEHPGGSVEVAATTDGAVGIGGELNAGGLKDVGHDSRGYYNTTDDGAITRWPSFQASELRDADGKLLKQNVELSLVKTNHFFALPDNGGFGILGFDLNAMNVNRDNRVGLQEVGPKARVNTGLSSSKDAFSDGFIKNGCEILGATFGLGPSTFARAKLANGSWGTQMGWNADIKCGADLHKVGELRVSASGEMGMIFDGSKNEETYAKAAVSARMNKIGGTPVYAGVDWTHTGTTDNREKDRANNETTIVAGVAY